MSNMRWKEYGEDQKRRQLDKYHDDLKKEAENYLDKAFINNDICEFCQFPRWSSYKHIVTCDCNR